MKRAKKTMEKTTNSKVYKRARKELTCECSFCKPHRNENANRYGKHGCKKPKYKDKHETIL
jgi:hypothetical protein